MNTDVPGDGSVPLMEENTAYLQMETAAMPQTTPQQVVVTQPQAMQPVPYAVVSSSNEDTQNYLYSNKVGDLTICHWLACLFCNCCGCALIGFILNQLVVAAKSAGYNKLAFFIAEKAKCWMITACVCTTIPWIILVIFFAAGGISTEYISAQLNDMSGSDGY
eukprot:UN00614